MRGLGIGLHLVTVNDKLGQVLPMHRAESRDPASTPWASNFGPNLAT
jgi:hypothetical protein